MFYYIATGEKDPDQSLYGNKNGININLKEINASIGHIDRNINAILSLT